MSKALRTSGYVGLTIQMLWGLYNVYLIVQDRPTSPGPWSAATPISACWVFWRW